LRTHFKYSIKDLEVLSDIKSHTIRIWEKRYGILNPERTDTNIRYYTNESLKKLLNISVLRRHGIKISKIAEMPEAEINKKVLAINLIQSDNHAIIECLMLAMIDLDEANFQKILNIATVRFGFENAIIEIIFPLFHRIGILWQTGVINPAQEHFVSNVVRQKIISATDALDYKPLQNLPKIVLILPENELHELSLLFYNYALRYRSFPTVYLGQAVPLDSIERVIEICKPDILLCTFTHSLNTIDLKGILKHMSKAFDGLIAVSGRPIMLYKRKKPYNIRKFDSLEGLFTLLNPMK